MRKKVIYTGAFRFPNGDAAAARVLSIGKILKSLGYDVVFAGWEEHERSIDKTDDGRYFYQGFVYESMAELSSASNRPFFEKATDYFTKGKKTMRWVEKQSASDIYAIIIYNSNSYFLTKMSSYCKKNKINLVGDITEWYDGNQLPMGRYGLPSLDNALRMGFLNNKMKNLIVISSFLQNFYEKNHCNTIRIPPLVDFTEAKWTLKNRAPNKFLTLIYAGSPGKKDFIAPILQALIILKEKGSIVKLHIVGLNKEQTKIHLQNGFEKINDQIECFGRIPQEEVPSRLAEADYSILLRADKRYAHAGFSTKLIESLSMGLPVISNATGDIKRIIGANKNGVLVDSPTAESVVVGLSILLSENEQIHIERKKNARDYAISVFDYKTYEYKLGNYFEALSKE